MLIGLRNRVLQLFAYNAFPYQLTNTLQRWRGVRIGRQSHIARYVYIDDRNPDLVEIGNGVAISAGVMILAHQRDLSTHVPGRYVMENDFVEAPVRVEDGAHIGIRAILMPGVTVGTGAVVAAGAVVTRDVPPHVVVAGVPARVIRRLQ